MRKYLSLEDFAYTSGDSIKIHWEGGGFITTGGRSARMTIPIDRPIINAKSATLTGNLTIRQNSNYIFGDASEDTSITSLICNCQGITAAGVSFALENTEAYTNAENNSACGILFVGTITLI